MQHDPELRPEQRFTDERQRGDQGMAFQVSDRAVFEGISQACVDGVCFGC